MSEIRNYRFEVQEDHTLIVKSKGSGQFSLGCEIANGYVYFNFSQITHDDLTALTLACTGEIARRQETV